MFNLIYHSLNDLVIKIHEHINHAGRPPKFESFLATVEQELNNDLVIKNANYDRLVSSYWKATKDTPNIQMFTDSEIDSCDKFINQALLGVDRREKIIKRATQSILLNKSKRDTVKDFYNPFDLLELGISIHLIYAYDWLRYKVFLSDKNLNPNNLAEKKEVIPSHDLRIAAKWYALYHAVLIEMGIENQFERNLDDNLPASQIQAFAKERYPNCASPQRFYRVFKEIDITNKAAIRVDYGKGYKEKLIELSENNAKIIIHLKTYPN